MARGTKTVTRVFPRGKTQSLHFQFTDKTGRRSTIALGVNLGDVSNAEALRMANEKMRELESQPKRQYSFGELLALYGAPETNPRKREAMTTGASYGDEYAKKVAVYSAKISALLGKTKSAYVLKMPIQDVSRLDIKQIASEIVVKLGRCRTSQHYFQIIKRMMSQAFDDGLTSNNVSLGIRDISYEETRRSSIPSELISWMLGRKDLFPAERCYQAVFIMATTGMRRGELMALNAEQISDNGELHIDRALKSSSSDDVGKPKWGITRIIPLAKCTQDIIAQLHPDHTGRLFPFNRQVLAYDMIKLKAALMAADPQNKDIWAQLCPHVLRHSLNTNLLIAGVSPMLVAEYLSWKHQELMDMQRRYTHIVAKNLQPVADMVDDIYGKKSRKIKRFMA